MLGDHRMWMVKQAAGEQALKVPGTRCTPDFKGPAGRRSHELVTLARELNA